MTTGYSFRLGDMGHAECQKCGGIIRCGMEACEDRVKIALQLEIMEDGMVRYRDMLISLADK